MLRMAFVLILGVIGITDASARERPDFFRVRHGFATGVAKKGIVRAHGQVDRGAQLGLLDAITRYQIARVVRAAGQANFVIVKASCYTSRANEACDVKARIGATPVEGDQTGPIAVADTISSFEANPDFYRPY